jgi:hypothetical protein
LPGTPKPSIREVARAVVTAFIPKGCSIAISTVLRVMRIRPVEFNRRWTEVI